MSLCQSKPFLRHQTFRSPNDPIGGVPVDHFYDASLKEQMSFQDWQRFGSLLLVPSPNTASVAWALAEKPKKPLPHPASFRGELICGA